MKINSPRPNFSQTHNDNAEVLAHLIQFGCVSLKDFPYLAGFRTRISNLRLDYAMPIRSEYKEETNKRGRNFKYKVHYLDPEHKDFAVEVFRKINKA